MDNLSILEESFNRYINNLGGWLPDGVIEVDLKLLYDLDLLSYHEDSQSDPSLTRYFHVLETEEKITLVNEDFVVWIVPEQQADYPTTYILIALNTYKPPKLELSFSTSGVYNSSKLVLRVLEKFLVEIQENEELLIKMNGE